MHVHFKDERDMIRASEVHPVEDFLMVYTEEDHEVRLYPSEQIQQVSGMSPEDMEDILGAQITTSYI